mmetsp:Transcript_31885/g.59962  ORF Transcript_31885/g.59962 Transcript_31885/m.59962 type:complete len:277 (-) Transcript_31885:152-982(-)
MAALGVIVKPFFPARNPKKESRTSRANVVSVQAKRPSPANSCGSSEQGAITRRAAILVTTIASGVTIQAEPSFAGNAFEAGDGAEVQAYLPPSGDGYYEYSVRSDRTPALRAEMLESYNFVMPKGWKEQPVSNAISGNYCQPRCDEPTTEVKFASGKEGQLQVIIAPLTKLTRKTNPTIDQVGTIDGVLNSIGPYITGDFIEPEDVTAQKEINDGKKYFVYELETPYALTGTHNLASVTCSKNELVMMVVSCNDKQWNAAASNLRRIVESFRVPSV